MYASDLTHRKRAQAVYRNLQLQKEWFASGKTIRILGQKGGNDYSYMMELEQGCVNDICWKYGIAIPVTHINGPMSFSLSDMTRVNLIENGLAGGNPNIDEQGDPEIGVVSLDDGNVPIPTDGNDFYMFGVNYGNLNLISWNSNNAIIFGIPNTGALVNFGPTAGANLSPISNSFILLGNYERRLTSFYTKNYVTSSEGFSIIKFVAIFDDFFLYAQDASGNPIPPPTPPPQGTFSVRLIRELSGDKRQWVEVSIIQSPPSPGYSNNPLAVDLHPYTVAGKPADSQGFLIDPTKSSPYDISNGISLLNICGSQFSLASPAAGTSFVFQSDSFGAGWSFFNNSYLNV